MCSFFRMHRRLPRPTVCAAALLGTTASLLPVAARADLSGFGMFAPLNSTGKTTSVGFSDDKTTLTLTDGGKQEASSAWAREPQPIQAFTASFLYQATNFGPTAEEGGGDGIAFALQNDPRGTSALGGAGNALGYARGSVSSSIAVLLNLFGNPGEAIGTNGIAGTFGDTGDVNFRSGHPIQVTLDCDGATIQETMKDTVTGETFTDVHAVDLSVLGSTTARVGFTGASGDSTALQTIRDFTFTPRAAVPPNKQRHVAPPPPKVYHSLTDYVDPLIGTAGAGNTYPGAVAPFGMVQFSPDTRAHSIGYEYGDRQIEGFSLTHMSGVGCDDFGDVFLTATTGPVRTDPPGYISPFSHRHETATPGYYAVHLNKPNVDAELTATTHAGIIRFAFPAGQAANILVPISHTLTYTYAAKVHIVGDREIEGEVTSKTFCGTNQSYTVYFVMHLDQPFQTFGTFAGTNQTAGSRTVAQAEKEPAIGAYVSYPAVNKSRVVTAQIGISFVDLPGARNNLAKEVAGKSFDAIRKQTAADWEANLKVAEVQGGTATQRTVFYTSLYHCLLMPNIASDVDGRYTGFDNKIHTMAKGRTLYANFSGWDIYRTEAPLLALIAPGRVQDMCESIALMYQQGGWIDRWPQANAYTNVMCGSPLTTMVATAYNYGLRNFDMPTLYEGMLKDATQPAPPSKPYAGEANVAWMDKVGYIPDDKEHYGAVSQTEEDCYAYAALSSIAAGLGKKSDAEMLRKRALNYRNLFDPETKFLRPRLADGTWYAPFNPTQEHGYVEGSGWHYRWLAPQDVAGLIHLFGSDDAFNTEMDSFFAQVNGNSRYYNPYNETDLQAPFLYDYSGAPWKTQALVRKLLAQVYKTTPDGIPGNDDCGTMSAWAIFAMLGLYPTDPARPAFELCSPVFPSATLHLKGKPLTITAPDATDANAYIQSVHGNKGDITRPWINITDLTQGGTLTFRLTAQPNKTWGSAAADRPPSLSQ